MKQELTIAKIGGNIIDNEEELQAFLADFAKLDTPKILVHGGGKSATKLAEQLGIPQKMIDGRRVTDTETLKLITMVYGGLINKNITALLAAKGSQSLGVSGADANLILSRKRSTNSVDFGFVGDVEQVNATTLSDILELRITPVFCALTHDGRGRLLNTNADTVATEIAIAMSTHYKTKLYFCFEKRGVLRNIEDPESRIPILSTTEFEQLKAEQLIYEGMLPKLSNAFKAANNGVEEVYILHSSDFYHQNTTTENYGTTITSK